MFLWLSNNIGDYLEYIGQMTNSYETILKILVEVFYSSVFKLVRKFSKHFLAIIFIHGEKTITRTGYF